MILQHVYAPLTGPQVAGDVCSTPSPEADITILRPSHFFNLAHDSLEDPFVEVRPIRVYLTPRNIEDPLYRVRSSQVYLTPL